MGNAKWNFERALFIFVVVFTLGFSSQSISNAQSVMSIMSPSPMPSEVIIIGDHPVVNANRLLEDEEYFNDVLERLEKELEESTAAAELTLKRINDSMRELK